MSCSFPKVSSFEELKTADLSGISYPKDLYCYIGLLNHDNPNFVHTKIREYDDDYCLPDPSDKFYFRCLFCLNYFKTFSRRILKRSKPYKCYWNWEEICEGCYWMCQNPEFTKNVYCLAETSLDYWYPCEVRRLKTEVNKDEVVLYLHDTRDLDGEEISFQNPEGEPLSKG
jgi:hypothetical protein